MNITTDHFIDTARRNIIHGGSPMESRHFAVWHFTGGATGESSIGAMRERGVSAHLVIERDGSIWQCRPFNLTAGHAGESRWKDPKTGKNFNGCNLYSIGIEIANAGDDDGALAWTKKHGGKTAMAKHWQGGKIEEWEIYPDAQIAAVLAVSKLLLDRYSLDDFTGHEYIAPERKNDPGPLFPMQSLREQLGFAGLPAIHRK